MPLKSIIIAGIACAGLAACGDTIGEQALVGGAVGAGAAAVTSGSVLTGAAVGVAGNVAYCQVYPHKCN